MAIPTSLNPLGTTLGSVTITIDDYVTQSSSNPVKSSGIYLALTQKQDKLTISTTLTNDNSIPTGSAVYTALTYHTSDFDLHNSPDQAAQIRYLINNYGKTASLPIPQPHEDDPEHGEGTWTYLTDEELNDAGYFRESDVKSQHGGKWPVYGVILPWYNQRTGAAETRPELYTGSVRDIWGSTDGPVADGLLPDCCNGCPWLFDSLIEDATTHQMRPRRWAPSLVGTPEIDEWADEELFKWWDVNYVRCNNGNRRITAISRTGDDSFKTAGNVDVGVAFHKRYIFFGRVEADVTTNGITSKRDFTLLLIAGGQINDGSFPTEYASFISENFTAVDVDGTRLGNIQLDLWKENQYYVWDNVNTRYNPIPVPYGLHSKYHSVLGGEGTTGCLPRSQPGHLLTNVSHNLHVTNTSTVTDGVTGKKGYTDYHRKGGASYGSGMDRMLFIGLHLMMKTGSKNTQKYMRGVVDSGLPISIQCAMSTADAQDAGLIPSGDNLYAVVKSQGFGNFTTGDFVTVGANGRDFGTSTVIMGQITEISNELIHGDIHYRLVQIAPYTLFGKTSFTHTAAQYLNRVLPPCGATDVLLGLDGSPYSLQSGKSPCRFMGTEYAMGTWNINLDTTLQFKTGNLLKVWYAQPHQQRQTTETDIVALYTPLGPEAGFGKSGSYYGADLVVDVVRGTYYQTAPVSGTGTSAQGLCDQMYKENTSSGMRAYCAFGGTFYLTGLAAGVFGVCVNISTYAGLTSGYWSSCSYGFANKMKQMTIACVITIVIYGNMQIFLT